MKPVFTRSGSLSAMMDGLIHRRLLLVASWDSSKVTGWERNERDKNRVKRECSLYPFIKVSTRANGINDILATSSPGTAVPIRFSYFGGLNSSVSIQYSYCTGEENFIQDCTNMLGTCPQSRQAGVLCACESQQGHYGGALCVHVSPSKTTHPSGY